MSSKSPEWDLVEIELWVPGPLRNPMNGSRGHWSKHARWSRQWRERACLAFLEARQTHRGRWPWPASAPKRIHFHCQTWNTLDDDALPAICKPLRDATVDAGISASDAPKAGNVYTYSQAIDRAHRGVRITVTLV